MRAVRDSFGVSIFKNRCEIFINLKQLQQENLSFQSINIFIGDSQIIIQTTRIKRVDITVGGVTAGNQKLHAL